MAAPRYIFNKVLCFAIPVSASLVLPDGEIVAEERGTIQVYHYAQ